MSHPDPDRVPKSRSVAVVVSRFPTLTETFILRELIALEQSGAQLLLVPLLRHRVAVLHPEARRWVTRALYSPFVNGRILRTNLWSLFRSPSRYLRTLRDLLFDVWGDWGLFWGVLGIFPKSVWLGHHLRSLGVSHVHAHFATHPAACAYIMSRVRGSADRDLPYSITAHGHDIFLSSKGLRRKLSGAEFVRSISKFNRDFLMDQPELELRGRSPDRFPVIHCGVDPERYERRARPGVPGKDRPALLLCVAAYRPKKGLESLIEAVGVLRARKRLVECEIIGEGKLRPRLERLVRERQLTNAVRLLGARTEDQVRDALAACDLFVLPSETEGIPVSVMEALASGAPVLSTSISGIPELVRDRETGFLVPPSDTPALVEALEEILDSPELAARVARAGREWVAREFSITESARRLLAEIERTEKASGPEPAGERARVE